MPHTLPLIVKNPWFLVRKSRLCLWLAILSACMEPTVTQAQSCISCGFISLNISLDVETENTSGQLMLSGADFPTMTIPVVSTSVAPLYKNTIAHIPRDLGAKQLSEGAGEPVPVYATLSLTSQQNASRRIKANISPGCGWRIEMNGVPVTDVELLAYFQPETPPTYGGMYTAHFEYTARTWVPVAEYQELIIPVSNDSAAVQQQRDAAVAAYLDQITDPNTQRIVTRDEAPPAEENQPEGAFYLIITIEHYVPDTTSSTIVVQNDDPNAQLDMFAGYDPNSWVQDETPISEGSPQMEQNPDSKSFRLVLRQEQADGSKPGDSTPSGPMASPPMTGSAGAPGSALEGALPVNMSFSLGHDSEGKSVGEMFFAADLSSPNTVASVTNFKTRGAEEDSLNVLAQGSSYTITSPNSSTVTTVTPAGDGNSVQVHVATGATAISYTLTKIASGGDPGLAISRTAAGLTRTWKYYGSVSGTGGKSWREEHPDGSFYTGLETPFSGGIKTLEVEHRTSAGVGAPTFGTRTVTKYVFKPWNSTEITEEVVYLAEGLNAPSRVTSYVFNENPGEPSSYGKLLWRTDPDGGWQRYEYAPSGKLAKTYRPWKDGPATPAEATMANARVSGEENGFQKEWVAGELISQTQTFENSNAPLLGPSGSGVSAITQAMLTGPFNHVKTEVRYAMGTLMQSGDIYTKAGDSTTGSSVSLDGGGIGQVSGYAPLTGGGRRTVQREVWASTNGSNPTYNPLTRVSETNANGEVISEKQYVGTTLVSTATHEYEAGSGHRTRTTLDGQIVFSSTRVINAEGGETITDTDATGIQTRTVTGLDGRVISTTKFGYNGKPDIVTTTDRDGLTETTTTEAGNLKRVSSVTRDGAGRTVSSTHENGVTTNYVYELDGRRVIEKDAGDRTLRITEYYLDGQLKSVTGPAVTAEYHDYDVENSTGILTHTVHYGTENSARWRKTRSNAIGQALEEIQPGPNENEIVTTHWYDSSGRRTRSTTAGRGEVRLTYAAGGLQSTGVNANMDANVNGTDNSSDPWVVYQHVSTPYDVGLSGKWHRSGATRFLGHGAANEVSETKTKLGLGSNDYQIATQADGSQIYTTTTVDRANRRVTTVTTSNRTTNPYIRVVENGLLISSTSPETYPSATTYTYDALERLVEVREPTGVTRKVVYDDANDGTISDRVKQEFIKPAGGSSWLLERSHAYYGGTHESAGRLQQSTNADGTTVLYTYNLRGQLLTQSGTASYPQRFEYDAYGQMIKLHTYRTSNPNLTQPGDVTEWHYDPATGLQTAKEDAAGAEVSFVYDDLGRLHSRTWARGVVTVYSYDGANRLTGVDYSDTTPDVSFTHYRSGRVRTRSDGAGLHTMSKVNTNWSEATTNHTALGGLTMLHKRDAQGRLTGWQLSRNSTALASSTRSYDGADQLSTVSLQAGAQPATTWSYWHNLGRVGSITAQLPGGNVVQERQYDSLGRVSTIRHRVGTNVVLGWSYGYDPAMRFRRTSTTSLVEGLPGWAYGYNDRGEVTAAVRTDSSAAPVAGQEWGYAYDSIGNRVASTRRTAPSVVPTVYTANALNQYTSVEHPAQQEISGVTGGNVPTVRVNGDPVSGRPPGNGEPNGFAQWATLTNGTGSSRWQQVEVEAERPNPPGASFTSSKTGYRYVPPAVESPSHDLDGNLLEDAQWVYTWDGENRLAAMEMKEVDTPLEVALVRLEFVYDGYSRRVGKKVLERVSTPTGAGGALERPMIWNVRETRWFMYEDWNLLAELSGETGDALLRTYAWGVDLSGTLYGAGGVGGLLGIREAAGRTLTVCGEVNGNVMGLLDGTTTSLAARWDYDAFGNIVTTWSAEGGTELCPLGFSTKYRDAEAGLVNYGYRYYAPGTGRWLGRDPLGEHGGVHLYGAARNNLLGRVDVLGLLDILIHNNIQQTFNDKTGAQVKTFDLLKKPDMDGNIPTGSVIYPRAGNPDTMDKLNLSDYVSPGRPHPATNSGNGYTFRVMAAFTDGLPEWTPGQTDSGSIKPPKNLVAKGRVSCSTIYLLLVTMSHRPWKSEPKNGMIFPEVGDPTPYIKQVMKIEPNPATGALTVTEVAGNTWQAKSESKVAGFGGALAAHLNDYLTPNSAGVVNGYYGFTYTGSGGWSARGIVGHLGAGWGSDPNPDPKIPWSPFLQTLNGEPSKVSDSHGHMDGSPVSVGLSLETVK